MIADRTVRELLEDIASSSPAPGGGSVAALSGALGTALTGMVCRLTIGKKKYAQSEAAMKKTLAQADSLRSTFVALSDRDTRAFEKVMEAYGLPKDSDPHKALRDAAIREATKEAALVPLEVMRHCIDALALAKDAASLGNPRVVSDAGVGAIMLHAACRSAALNVAVNLNALDDQDFVGWKRGELQSLESTSAAMLEEINGIVAGRLAAP